MARDPSLLCDLDTPTSVKADTSETSQGLTRSKDMLAGATIVYFTGYPRD